MFKACPVKEGHHEVRKSGLNYFQYLVLADLYQFFANESPDMRCDSGR